MEIKGELARSLRPRERVAAQKNLGAVCGVLRLSCRSPQDGPHTQTTDVFSVISVQSGEVQYWMPTGRA